MTPQMDARKALPVEQKVMDQKRDRLFASPILETISVA